MPRTMLLNDKRGEFLTMKCRIVFTCLVLSAISLAMPANAFALFIITITVDESGNGTLTNSSGFSGNLPSLMSPDPGPGGLASALTYGLLNPPGLVAGDLLLLEPGGNGALSEVIRFNPQQGGGSLVFYSDNSDGVDALADTGFPTAQYANILVLSEVGTEGNNGFSYTPTAGQPGFVAGAGGLVTYELISDAPPASAVPEPSSVAMLALGGIGLAGWRQWSKRRLAAA